MGRIIQQPTKKLVNFLGIAPNNRQKEVEILYKKCGIYLLTLSQSRNKKDGLLTIHQLVLYFNIYLY